ncbi:hypothetical protein GTP58_00305 [Duganella sp. CY15W]|uniref:hypothetical protein n=1 Tax=Duganella sp. CY15W TaxID=2692172 RepID=UPI0013721F16|nr:hypothetical protein [Duganella sp. CY15W]MYM26758.1 hypothetical protein [Duganella sp. CY15W]
MTEAELGKFAEEYGRRFFGHWKREVSTEGQPIGVGFLVFQIRATNHAQQERLAKFQADVDRLHSSPTMKAIREAQKLKDLLFPPHVVAMQKALEITNCWDEIQKLMLHSMI